jgi:hypothetical protein
MSLTLIESAKTLPAGIQRATIEIYAKEAPILGVLPFTVEPSGTYRYTEEATLPGIGFRGVNEAFSESTGVLNPKIESAVIAGGDADVDKFILATNPGRRAVETAMKIKAMSLAWGAKFFKGSSLTEPREFDGLQTRLGGNQLIAAGSASGGDALSLYKLDQAIAQTYNPGYLAMDKAMRLRLTQAARNTSVGGNIGFTVDQFGRQVTVYNGLPILEVGQDNTGTDVLGFTEANPGGGSAVGTSIYVLGLGLDSLFGFQVALPSATDLGEQDAKPVFRTRVEWHASIALTHPRAATRLYGIKDAAVTA